MKPDFDEESDPIGCIMIFAFIATICAIGTIFLIYNLIW